MARVTCEFCGHSPLEAHEIPDPGGRSPWLALVCPRCHRINWRIPNPPRGAPEFFYPETKPPQA